LDSKLVRLPSHLTNKNPIPPFRTTESNQRECRQYIVVKNKNMRVPLSRYYCDAAYLFFGFGLGERKPLERVISRR